MKYSFSNILAILVGIMSTLVVIYRIIVLMIPMIIKGVKTDNIPLIFQGLSLLE